MTRISILLMVLLLTVAAGCGTPASSSAEATEEATPTPSPTPDPTPTDQTGGVPSMQPGAGDLADLLPTEIGGLTIQYTHMAGAEVFDAEGISAEQQEFLDRVGAEPENVTSAFGFAFDAEAQTGVSILAFRVEGADEGTLREGFLSAMEDAGTPIGEEATLGGKSVTFMGDAQATNGYLYVHDDVAYLVSGEPRELAEEALAALP